MRELLTNVARHSRAHHVQLELQRQKASLQLRVQDDGVGLAQAAAVSDGTRQGLGNVASRARLLGGTLSITHVQPSGTKVLVNIPLSGAGTGTVKEG